MDQFVHISSTGPYQSSYSSLLLGKFLAMASFSSNLLVALALLIVFVLGSANAQLSTGFYKSSCPKLEATVKSTVHSAILKEARMGASLLRLFFHDCFVNVIFPIYAVLLCFCVC